MGLAERAHRAIKIAILSCQLGPGEMLTLDGLSAELGTSRSPVQDALRELAKEGLVTIKPQAGHFVTPLSLDRLRESFEVRLNLETAAVQLAIRRASDHDMEILTLGTPALANTLKVRKPELVPIFAGVTLHNMFHVRIAGLAKNVTLVNLIFEQCAPMTRASVTYLAGRKRPGPEEFTNAHEAVLDALKARDTEAAVQAMREHLVEGFNELKTLFESEGAEEAGLETAAVGPPLGPYADTFAK